MFNSLSRNALPVWFYVLCVMIMIQTQLISAEQECRDRISNCKKPNYKWQCLYWDMKRDCYKSCGYCGGKKPTLPPPPPTQKPTPDDGVCKNEVPDRVCARSNYLCKKDIHIRNQCKKSCGVCQPGSTVKKVAAPNKAVAPAKPTPAPAPAKPAPAHTGEKCINKHGDKRCKYYNPRSKAIACRGNYIRRNCAKTCGVCSTSTPPPPPSTPAHKAVAPAKPTPAPAPAKPAPAHNTAQGIECKNTKSEQYCIDHYQVCVHPKYPNVKKECKKTCALCPGYKNDAYTPMKKSSRVPYKELAADAKEVYFNCNEISAIRIFDFKRLTRVWLLLLSNNKIARIDDNSFSSLKQLWTLALSVNKLTRITSRTFAGITRLRNLYLDNNHISSIQSKSFYYIPKLVVVKLEANRLKSVSEDMFPAGYKDLEIGLYLNPIKCDNRIKWFVKGVKSKRIRSNNPPCQDMLQ